LISLFIQGSTIKDGGARRGILRSRASNFARNSVSHKREQASLTVVEHPLIAAKLSILRAKTTVADEFRRNLQEISILLLCDASRSWKKRTIQVETPLSRCDGEILATPIVLVPILRAGLGMLEGMLRVLPGASVGHIGIYRDEETLQPVTYFCRLPVNLAEAQVILVDPMLATGNSACEAVALLKDQGAKKIQFVCIVACAVGIERVQTSHPDVEIFTAAIDPELNKFGFIVPGLGDAGDRSFGTG
jgi:uracil phosphoribosyltransferase